MATKPTKPKPRDRKKQTCCYAPGCRSGYARAPKSPKASMFCAPRDEELRKVWQRNLRRLDKPLTERSVVCERHFDPRFIMRDFVHIVNGTEVRIPRDRPMLAPGAVPTLLPDLPGYLSKKLPKPRPTKGRQAVTAPPTPRSTRKTYGDTPTAKSPQIQPEPAVTSRPTVVHLGDSERTNIPQETPPEEPPKAVEAGPLTIERLKNAVDLPSREWSLINTLEALRVVFATSTIRTGEETMEVLHPKCVSFSAIEGPEVVAEAFFDGASCCRAIVTTMEEAEAMLQDAHSTHMCKGAMSKAEFGVIRKWVSIRSQRKMGRNEVGTVFSLECERNVIAEGVTCPPCKTLRKLLQNKKSRIRMELMMGNHHRQLEKTPQPEDGTHLQDSPQAQDSPELQESMHSQENVQPEESPCPPCEALNGSA